LTLTYPWWPQTKLSNLIFYPNMISLKN